jgi:hypothetical protein
MLHIGRRELRDEDGACYGDTPNKRTRSLRVYRKTTSRWLLPLLLYSPLALRYLTNDQPLQARKVILVTVYTKRSDVGPWKFGLLMEKTVMNE